MFYIKLRSFGAAINTFIYKFHIFNLNSACTHTVQSTCAHMIKVFCITSLVLRKNVLSKYVFFIIKSELRMISYPKVIKKFK